MKKSKTVNTTPQKTASGRTVYAFRQHAYMGLLGLHRVVPQSGDSQTELLVDERHINPNGTMHGGAIFSLVDTCMAGALRKHLVPPEFSATIECKINFTKAVKAGTTLICTSSVANRGGRVAVIESEVRDDADGSLVAKAMSTYYIIRPKTAPAPAAAPKVTGPAKRARRKPAT